VHHPHALYTLQNLTGSIKHVLEHPSDAAVLPSSQASLKGEAESSAPLPQAQLQSEAGFVPVPSQMYPVSTVHVLEHPSDAAVLPSSQSSRWQTLKIPSPHTGSWKTAVKEILFTVPAPNVEEMLIPKVPPSVFINELKLVAGFGRKLPVMFSGSVDVKELVALLSRIMRLLRLLP